MFLWFTCDRSWKSPMRGSGRRAPSWERRVLERTWLACWNYFRNTRLWLENYSLIGRCCRCVGFCGLLGFVLFYFTKLLFIEFPKLQIKRNTALLFRIDRNYSVEFLFLEISSTRFKWTLSSLSCSCRTPSNKESRFWVRKALAQQGSRSTSWSWRTSGRGWRTRQRSVSTISRRRSIFFSSPPRWTTWLRGCRMLTAWSQVKTLDMMSTPHSPCWRSTEGSAKLSTNIACMLWHCANTWWHWLSSTVTKRWVKGAGERCFTLS